VLRDVNTPASRLARLSCAEARRAIADDVVTGGMIAKLKEAMAVIDQGVGAIHILGKSPPATSSAPSASPARSAPPWSPAPERRPSAAGSRPAAGAAPGARIPSRQEGFRTPGPPDMPGVLLVGELLG
jgi:hypothetical protein